MFSGPVSSSRSSPWFPIAACAFSRCRAYSSRGRAASEPAVTTPNGYVIAMSPWMFFEQSSARCAGVEEHFQYRVSVDDARIDEFPDRNEFVRLVRNAEVARPQHHSCRAEGAEMHEIATRGEADRLGVGIEPGRNRLGDLDNRVIEGRLGRGARGRPELEDLGTHPETLPGERQDALQLLDGSVAIVPRNEAPIHHQIAGFGHDGVSRARLCTRHGQAWRADQRMML